MRIFFNELGKEIFNVSYTLFKIMVPAIIIVKLLDSMGFTRYLSYLLSPLMEWVGLPDSMGLVIATTMFTNMYTGMIIFADLHAVDPLSIAQVSVLGCLMLMAHGLPVEVAIAKKSGVAIWVVLLSRIGGGFAFAWMVNAIYQAGDWLQQPATMLWQSSTNDGSLSAWAISQIESLVMIQIIIIVLLFFLKVLKTIGFEALMVRALQPLLRMLGIGKSASTISIIGILLGLSFGGGLLINEAKKGTVPHRDIFITIVMLGLLHSIIEDTLLVLLLGADIGAVLFARIFFTFVVIAILSRLVYTLSDTNFYRYLYKPVNK